MQQRPHCGFLGDFYVYHAIGKTKLNAGFSPMWCIGYKVVERKTNKQYTVFALQTLFFLTNIYSCAKYGSSCGSLRIQCTEIYLVFYQTAHFRSTFVEARDTVQSEGRAGACLFLDPQPVKV